MVGWLVGWLFERVVRLYALVLHMFIMPTTDAIVFGICATLSICWLLATLMTVTTFEK